MEVAEKDLERLQVSSEEQPRALKVETQRSPQIGRVVVEVWLEQTFAILLPLASVSRRSG